MIALRIYTKPPVEGRTKRRLARAIGDGPAAAVHAAFLEDLVERFRASRLRVVLDASERHQSLDALAARTGIAQSVQIAGDLGARMSHSIDESLREHDAVLIVGSDVPTITLAEIDAAVRALETSDTVFAPTPDGGFGLVGARVRVEFGPVRWSSPHALADSLESLARCGLTSRRIAPVLDVDDAEALRVLRAQLGLAPSLARVTARLLDEMRP